MEEIKELVETIKYKTNDGRVFSKKEDAQLHEDLQSGGARVCPRCEGKKSIDCYGDGRLFAPCEACGGKGHQYKVVEWK